MRIKKTSETTPFGGAVVNVQNDSTTNTYSCNYVNNLNTYSTTEQRIGTWIDGKPLYRTTVELGNLPNATAVSINHSISNIDKIVKLYGFASEQGTGWYIVLPNVGATQATSVVLSASRTVIYVVPGNDRSNWLGWATLEYTKTTD